jgi:hypothetical protein
MLDSDSDSNFDSELRTMLEPERTSIDDAGFSQSVISRLPTRRASWHRRQLIVPCMTFIGCLLGLVVFPGGDFLRDMLADIPHAHFVSTLPVPWLILVYTLCWTTVTSMSNVPRMAHPENLPTTVGRTESN